MKRGADGSSMDAEAGSAKMMHFRLLLPNKQTGTVIGKGGANIKSIREASGCQVQISENVPGATDRLVTIIGDSSVINSAVARLLAILDEDPQASMVVDTHADTNPGERMLRILLSNNEAGRIIGKGGARIKQMRNESGAQVHMPPLCRCCATPHRTAPHQTCPVRSPQVRMDPESGADRTVALVGSREAIVEVHRQIVLAIADMPPDRDGPPGAKRQQLSYPGAHAQAQAHAAHAAHAAAAGYAPHMQMPSPLSGGGHAAYAQQPAYAQQQPAYLQQG